MNEDAHREYQAAFHYGWTSDQWNSLPRMWQNYMLARIDEQIEGVSYYPRKNFCGNKCPSMNLKCILRDLHPGRHAAYYLTTPTIGVTDRERMEWHGTGGR